MEKNKFSLMDRGVDGGAGLEITVKIKGGGTVKLVSGAVRSGLEQASA